MSIEASLKVEKWAEFLTYFASEEDARGFLNKETKAVAEYSTQTTEVQQALNKCPLSKTRVMKLIFETKELTKRDRHLLALYTQRPYNTPPNTLLLMAFLACSTRESNTDMLNLIIPLAMKHDRNVLVPALVASIRNGRLDMLEHLLTYVKVCPPSLYCKLIEAAAMFGNVVMVKYLHDLGAECSGRVLWYAAMADDSRVASYVLGCESHDIRKSLTEVIHKALLYCKYNFVATAFEFFDEATFMPSLDMYNPAELAVIGAYGNYLLWQDIVKK